MLQHLLIRRNQRAVQLTVFHQNRGLQGDLDRCLDLVCNLCGAFSPAAVGVEAFACHKVGIFPQKSGHFRPETTQGVVGGENL